MKTTHPKNLHRRSTVAKSTTGIEGLDEITGGGLPRGRTTVLLGGPGCGKTVLALQTLVNGAREQGEPGIFVAFEENTRQIVRNAASFGWDLPGLERDQLFFLDARPRTEEILAGDFDLVGFLASLDAQARRMGAKRIVFDSIDVLLSALDDVAKERREIHRLVDWLAQSGLTAILTGKLEEASPGGVQRYGFLQFMADCAVVLSRHSVERISQRELRVIKYRGSAFAENAAPMVIGDAGIMVAHISATERVYAVSRTRVSSGVSRLDTMLGGGYYQGSSVLITGAPGTAKSTLSGAFLAAACRRGARALYISFDEIAGEHERNLASVGIKLAPHLASGRLQIYAARSEASNIEEHLVRIHGLIRKHRARFVVFDPLSSLFRSGTENSIQSAAERLLNMTKSMGITTVCTSVLSGADVRLEGTPLEVSTIADTWIHLSYAVQAGERNRALTIVKSRGMAHSNQVRELLLSRRGVTLADVYTAGGEVLMGAMRCQQEKAEHDAEMSTRLDMLRRQQEIRLAEAGLNAQLAVLRRELEIKRTELGVLAKTESRRRIELGQHAATMREFRQADRSWARS